MVFLRICCFMYCRILMVQSMKMNNPSWITCYSLQIFHTLFCKAFMKRINQNETDWAPGHWTSMSFLFLMSSSSNIVHGLFHLAHNVILFVLWGFIMVSFQFMVQERGLVCSFMCCCVCPQEEARGPRSQAHMDGMTFGPLRWH